MTLTVRVLQDRSQLEPWRQWWQDVAPTPLQSPQWMMAWWDAFRTPTMRLHVLLVETEEGSPAGLLPLYARDSWSMGRTLRLLGSGRACTDLQQVLVAPERAAEIGEALARSIFSPLNRPPAFVELEGLGRHATGVEPLVECLQQAGWVCHRQQLESTWKLSLADGWNGFLANQSTTQRRQSRNLINRFHKNSALALQWLREPSEIEVSLPILIDLHQQRWQAAGEPGCFADLRFRRFLTQACQSLAEIGRVRLGLLTDSGRAIAAQLFLIDSAGDAFMYQTGRDPTRGTQSVGRVLNLATIERACQEGLQSIDYLRGDEAYKARLGARAADCLRLRLVAPRPLPRLRHSAWTLGRRLKQQCTSWKPAGTPAAED